LGGYAAVLAAVLTAFASCVAAAGLAFATGRKLPSGRFVGPGVRALQRLALERRA
jgi:hypothetical protein